MKTLKLKRIISALLAALLIAACAGCGSASPEEAVPSGREAPESSAQEAAGVRPESYSQDEYVLYQNIFYKDYGKDYDGKKVEKEGVFAELYDAYNSRQRYYVWGYYDQTKCCDWQWEFVPREGESLPPVGSLVTVTGTFVYDDDALDKYWITDAQIGLKTAYSGQTAETDMYSMSCTLERVQMLNIKYRSDAFNDKEFLAYGRIASLNSLEDPYYDGSWEIDFTWDGTVPAIGTLVMLSGRISDGKLSVASMENI